MISTKDPYFSSLAPTLNDLFSNKITAEQAAAQLAAITLSPTEQDLFNENEKESYDTYHNQNTTERLWTCIIQHARESPQHHPKLLKLLVEISNLPSPVAPSGEPLRDTAGVNHLYWSEMPRFGGWEINAIYNSFSTSPGLSVSEIAQLKRDIPHVTHLSAPVGMCTSERRVACLGFANANKFVAQLLKAKEPIFNYRMFALWTFRGALETPWKELRHGDLLEAWVPAAVGWLEGLGEEIYEWEDEWAYGTHLGDRGGGGPLWKGKHGFCKERWRFWRERFGKIAKDEQAGRDVVDEDVVRAAAKRAEAIMMKIEVVKG